MAQKPRRAHREPAEGSRFPSQIVADNVRAFRLLRRLKQSDVAVRMTSTGHRWSPTTVSEVENGLRAVTVDELVGLAIILQVGVPILLDPTGPESRDTGTRIDIGSPDGPVSAGLLWSTLSAERPAFHLDFDESGEARSLRHTLSPEMHDWRKDEEKLKEGWSAGLEEPS
jgi:transcriptional regulator with XRE-family HTH domain